MSDLLTWYRAQLDEDERIALAATQGEWSVNSGRYAEYIVSDGGTCVVAGGRWGDEASVFETTEDAIHIARHDPASVPADIAAKRAIVDKLEFLTAGTTPSDRVRGLQAAYREVVRLLASAYAHRPGYLPEWSPVRSET